MATEITSGYILTAEELENNFKIFAGPGAGKTYFLTKNIENIIYTEKKIKQFNTKKVLCITYTNAAVDEIKSRISVNLLHAEIFTIHSFIIENIINPYQEALKIIIMNKFGISISSNKKITSQIEGVGLLHGVNKEDIFEYINKKMNTTNNINYSKFLMSKIEIDIEEYSKSEKMNIKRSNSIIENHTLYIKEFIWSEVSLLTHDEILIFGYEILKNNPLILYTIRNKFPYILIDEYQDTNPIQTKIVKLIGQEYSIIGVVGDKSQSIYSFQGAHPEDFENLDLKNMKIYSINGNRRSSQNIVSFCNLLRSGDSLLQKSIREYKNQDEKKLIETITIKILIKGTDNYKTYINQIIESEDSAILTRTWAGTFKYIQDISDEDSQLLKNIYNSYFNTPIDIRNDIFEANYVEWVKFFKFIFSFYEFYKLKNINFIYKSLKIYFSDYEIKQKKLLSLENIILFEKIASNIFKNHSDEFLVCDYYQKIYDELQKEEINNIKKNFYIEEIPRIIVFSELERDNLKENVSKLKWKVSKELFEKVFSSNSKYMTVHQAKGLEWKTVLVDFDPSRNDKVNEDEILDINITDNNSKGEFKRIIYVGCSRAKDELYISINESSRNKLVSEIESFEEKINFEIFK